MKSQSATLKIGTPEIRVGLQAAKETKPNIEKRNQIAKKSESMPKEKKRLVKMPKRMKKM